MRALTCCVARSERRGATHADCSALSPYWADNRRARIVLRFTSSSPHSCSLRMRETQDSRRWRRRSPLLVLPLAGVCLVLCLCVSVRVSAQSVILPTPPVMQPNVWPKLFNVTLTPLLPTAARPCMLTRLISSLTGAMPRREDRYESRHPSPWDACSRTKRPTCNQRTRNCQSEPRLHTREFDRGCGDIDGCVCLNSRFVLGLFVCVLDLSVRR